MTGQTHWSNTEAVALRARLREAQAELCAAHSELGEARRKVADHDSRLNEINHRIFNGLHLAILFLRHEENRAEQADVRETLHDAARRVDAVARLHRFFMTKNISGPVSLKDYLCVALASISTNSGLDCILVSEKIDISEAMATDLGIAVAELVVNAAKHAYEPDEKGMIDIQCMRDGEGLRITVCDYGPGFMVGAAPPQSLGFGIVQSIVSRYQGTMSTASDDGGKITIAIPKV